jgi:uncharacterized membrane protein YfcA
VEVWSFTLLVGLGSFVAGFLGALTGLGGGVVIVPMLVVLFGIDLPYAIGASLVSVIATSSGAASAYVKEGYSNLRLAMVLEIATTTGALVGAALVAMAFIPIPVLSVIFGVVLIVSAVLSSRPHSGPRTDPDPDRLATWLRLHSSFPSPQGPVHYHVRHVPLGFGLMFLAGILSGLLGIGSGALKVLAMDFAMRIPFKVSTTTSNLMIGVTAAASASVYLGRGYIDPALALPVVLGVLLGSTLGARVLLRLNAQVLRIVFGLVIVALALQMLYKGIVGIVMLFRGLHP